MQAIENFMNKLTDMDWGWWPAVHLRPVKDENIDNPVLLKITPIFGTFAALIIILTSIDITILSGLIIFIVSWIAFFIIYKFTFAIAWNRRASRLRNLNEEIS